MASMAKPLLQHFRTLMAELQAIREGLQFCVDCGFDRTQIESDCQMAVKLLNGGEDYLGNNMFSVVDIENLLALYTGFSISFAHRESNCVAHELATLAFSLDNFKSWMEDIPLGVSPFLLANVRFACC